MLIYCSHKFGGKLENAKAAELKIKRLQLADPDNTYISPIHAFGFMYHDVDYVTGLRWCLDLLGKCDAMVVCRKNQEVSRWKSIIAMPIKYQYLDRLKTSRRN